jgi:hypothetical protein
MKLMSKGKSLTEAKTLAVSKTTPAFSTPCLSYLLLHHESFSVFPDTTRIEVQR